MTNYLTNEERLAFLSDLVESGMVEAIALFQAIILRRIYIPKISVLLFLMILHKENTRAMRQFAYETFDYLNEAYHLKFRIKKLLFYSPG